MQERVDLTPDYNSSRRYRVCAQILQRQQRGRTHQLTYVDLNLDVLKNLARSIDPLEVHFTSILRHDSLDGSWDELPQDDEEKSGNIYRLLSELHYLKHKARTFQERDEIQRWLWTCYETLKSDLISFSFGYFEV
jgi:hypothetical protein